MCQIDGRISAFSFITAICYYTSLSHCIMQSITEFQPKKRITGKTYHAMSIGAGLLYVVFSLIYSDIGKGVMLTCAMEYGSFIE